ncbi:hypothetical protein MB901379_00017 [Mycobacterium basiliense]|uniref:Uncharacterized protein n=1 Tax=Mycobacterium basiliense TaxID=2094119 RepID=A0A3S4BEE4_9MYCO|nr:hypothetical protein MB901379_00017 [Mycobacterium basiliense]
MLVEELLRSLPSSHALRTLQRLFTAGRGVTGASTEDVFLDLAQGGWLVPDGIGSTATWMIDASRRVQVDELWSTLSQDEARAVQVAAQRVIAVSVAWSNKRRTGVQSKTPTSKSSTP